jgi:Zn-dependent M16 (insulinase) family peptidase
MDWLMWRCKPEHEMVDEMRKNRYKKISARQSALMDRKAVLDDMEKVLRKRKLDEAADKLSLEDVPDDGPELDQMRELLRWAMNEKIISTG